jgi:hypothetical protein
LRLKVDRINHHNAREKKSEEERELNLPYSVCTAVIWKDQVSQVETTSRLAVQLVC